MSTLEPRPPYSQEELDQLYPKSLKLQLVQVLLRHGERSPVSARFQNAGLAPFWPYCNAARQLSSVTMASTDWSQWSKLEWRRRLETFGANDASVLATGPKKETDGICNMGELTDKGRETTLALGQRLRRLYVDQLKFMPKIIADADSIYLRATPMPRALESVQQAFWGFYPLTARTASFPPPTIVTRTPQDETLYPNDAMCARFGQLLRAFGQRTADRWNDTKDMEYLSSLISKWMPNQSAVQVDSHPRLSGIMDTINSTIAHGPETRLPAPFYDPKGRAIIDRIGVEEWFSGYAESREYRTVGIGALAGDIVGRMVGSIYKSGNDGLNEIGDSGRGRGGEQSLRLGLSGCHDTTLAALLTSLGCFSNEKWPPYTSHIAFELFRHADTDADASIQDAPGRVSNATNKLKALFSADQATTTEKLPGNVARSVTTAQDKLARKPTDSLTPEEKAKMEGYFVRIRYNDRVMTVPGCRLPGKHLEGDERFCTLEAFKSIVDKFTPRNWKESCASNLDAPAMPAQVEPAGY